jgi:flagellar protein FlgJ
MDITGGAALSVNKAYVPFSASSAFADAPASGGLAPGGGGAFMEILKRAQSSNASAGDGGPPSPSHSIPKNAAIDRTDKLYGLCVEFETILIKNLIKSMRGTVQKSKLIDTGFAGEMYEDMLYDEYAKSFAANAGFGFAEMAYRDLDRLRAAAYQS